MNETGRHRWSAARWILVVSPPRDRPNASRHGRIACSATRFLSFDPAPCVVTAGPNALLLVGSESDREPFRGHIHRRRLPGTSGVVVSPDAGRVHRQNPLRIVAVAGPHQLGQDLLPVPVGRPGPVPSVDGLPRSVRGRKITPRRPCPGPPHHPVNHPAVRRPRPPLTTGPLGRQQRLQRRPLLIGQIMTIMHPTITTRTGPKPMSDTP